MGMDLIVVRHGETEWNAEGRIQGHQQVPLNERGRRQAEAVAERLAQEETDRLYSSDLLRAMQTAEWIASRTGLEVVRDAGLREWKLGVLEGMTRVEAGGRWPEAVAAFDGRLPDAPIPGGETLRERFERVTAAFGRIASVPSGKRVAVVTHGGPLDDLYRFATGVPLEQERGVPLYNGGIHRIRVDDSGRWEVAAWAEVGHLAGIGAMADW